MCGISGAKPFTYAGEMFLQKMEDVNLSLLKRGPDGGAVFRNNKIALGHRRLSIIDTSCAGDQPMTTMDGRYTIIFNGEIFNYRQIMQQYLDVEEIKSLRSQSDTEIFLLLYSKLKEKAFPLLEGFFAAAIYDSKEDELILVRDRFGKKPLLLYQDEDKIIFASEMKALFKAGIPREVNLDILPVYLQLNYVPQPYSLVKGVRKVRPGHYVVIGKDGIKDKAFYQISIKSENYSDYSYEEAQRKLVKLMDEAVQKRMIADVPLGSFLSGGIDSSVVVALAAQHTDKVNTFSIGYKDNPYFDETAYAQLVASKYKTEHTVFSLGNEDFLEHVHQILEYLDEPFADSSAIPEYILCYYTRKHVTVALSGDGGDEVFGGYNKHGAEWKVRQGGLLNKAVKVGQPLWEALPHSRNSKLTNKFRQLHRFAEGAKLTAAERYWRWATFNSEKESLALLQPSIRNGLNKSLSKDIQEQFTAFITESDFNEILLADMNLVLVSDMLVKVDMMSMANSLEVRSPFLDHNVVDFAFGLPTVYKVNGRMKKRIVQDAFRSYLPDEIYNRPKKGFEIPLLNWFRNELWSLIDDDLLNDNFVTEKQIFDLTAIQSLKAKLRSSNPGDSHATIWALIVFQHWWKHYIHS